MADHLSPEARSDQMRRIRKTVTVRVPGDGIHAVATGVTQFRGKALPSDRSAQSVAALIPRAPNGYARPGPRPKRSWVRRDMSRLALN